MPPRATYTVGSFGLLVDDRRVLERVLSLSMGRANGYRLSPEGSSERPHIVLVDVDVPAAVEACKQALKGWGKPPPLVTVARTAPTNCRYHLRRPFMATRLLGLLDEVVSRSLSPADAVPTAPPSEQRAPASPSGWPPAPGPAPTPAGHSGWTAAPGQAAALAARVTPNDDAELRYRALVVDDSLAVRRQIGLALDAAAVRADYADSGEAALELLANGPYDIVFLDVVMPGMDGYAVCRTIKRNRTTRHLPVVMLTGKSSPFDKVKGKLSGCDTYLTKPVARKAFEDTLKAYLKQPILQD